MVTTSRKNLGSLKASVIKHLRNWAEMPYSRQEETKLAGYLMRHALAPSTSLEMAVIHAMTGRLGEPHRQSPRTEEPPF